MDMNLMVRGFVLSSLGVDVEEGDQEEEEEEEEEEGLEVEVEVGVGVVVVVGASDEALLHVVPITVSWFLDFPLLVVGKISKTICVMLVMFSSLMSLKMVRVLWSILVVMT